MKNGCWISELPSRSLWARIVVLTAVMLGAYGFVLFVVASRGGAAGTAAATLAAGVCLASATAALAMSHLAGRAALGAVAMLLPMMVRMAPPLLLAVIVRLRGRGLVEAGFVYYLIGFYLLALALELPMSLPRVERSCPSSEESKRESGNVHG